MWIPLNFLILHFTLRNSTENSTSFLVDPWSFHMFFLQNPWEFHVLYLIPYLDFFWNNPMLLSRQVHIWYAQFKSLVLWNFECWRPCASSNTVLQEYKNLPPITDNWLTFFMNWFHCRVLSKCCIYM